MLKVTFYWKRKPDRYKPKKLEIFKKLKTKTEILRRSGGETMNWKGKEGKVKEKKKEKGKENNPNFGLYPPKPKWHQKFKPGHLNF